jgi:hypothetical protein
VLNCCYGQQPDGLLLLSLSLDPIFESCQLPAFQEGIMSWCPKEKTYETDLAVLQWVEELEQRVILSDLQIRVYRDWHWLGNYSGEGIKPLNSYWFPFPKRSITTSLWG